MSTSSARIDEADVYKARIAGKLPPSGLRLIDAFAGAGGLTLGFCTTRSEAGSITHPHQFEPVWSNEHNEHAAASYETNFGVHCDRSDVVSLLQCRDAEIPRADVVVGGPPCQGFSLLNKKRAADVRKGLWYQFLDVVVRSGAEVFLIENVPQLLGSEEYTGEGGLKDIAENVLGFQVREAVLLAADYGVPQLRKRAFVLGCKYADPCEVGFPPKQTHARDLGGLQPWVTVRDAIGDLDPRPIGTEIRDVDPPYDLHFGRNPTTTSLERYKTIPGEGESRKQLLERRPDITPRCWLNRRGGTDVLGRLWWDRPANTIRTEFYKPEKGRFLHPTEHRALTHREAARIQSFPDGFQFCGKKSDIARQIGNAVPPLLAARLADCIYALFSHQRLGSTNQRRTQWDSKPTRRR